MSVHAINYVNNHLKPSQSRTKPCRPAWQKQGWNMDFARCGCHLADIQEPVSDPHELATPNKCGQAGIKDSVGRAGRRPSFAATFPVGNQLNLASAGQTIGA